MGGHVASGPANCLLASEQRSKPTTSSRRRITQTPARLPTFHLCSDPAQLATATVTPASAAALQTPEAKAATTFSDSALDEGSDESAIGTGVQTTYTSLAQSLPAP